MDTNIVLEALYYMSKRLDKPLEKLAALKLLFFADRYHLRKYGRLISEDTYYALPHGPVASNSLNIINSVLNGENTGSDKIYIERESKNVVKAVDDSFEIEYLSDSDMEAIDFALDEFGNLSAWDLRDLTHEYPEWKRYKETLESNLSRRELIKMEDFFENSNIEGDSYLTIPNRLVELSKEFYFNR